MTVAEIYKKSCAGKDEIALVKVIIENKLYPPAKRYEEQSEIQVEQPLDADQGEILPKLLEKKSFATILLVVGVPPKIIRT